MHLAHGTLQPCAIFLDIRYPLPKRQRKKQRETQKSEIVGSLGEGRSQEMICDIIDSG